MGRLKNRMPATYWTFLAGTLALCGLWPLSGFFSKDAILAAAWNNSKSLFAVGVFVAFLTSFYMFRLFFVVFLGKPKSDTAEHAHESPRVMTYPLIILAVASVLGGFFGIAHFITPFLSAGTEAAPIFAPFEPFRTAPLAAVLGLAAFAIGLAAAFHYYAGAESDPLPAKMTGVCRILRGKFYIDEFYAEVIAFGQDVPAAVFNALDAGIKLLVRLIHGTVELAGRLLRLAQTGNLQIYTLLVAAGIALVLYLMLPH
jgi:NADH-quinone oxidoreductase subunit L